jgi:hypothetical protein
MKGTYKFKNKKLLFLILSRALLLNLLETGILLPMRWYCTRKCFSLMQWYNHTSKFNLFRFSCLQSFSLTLVKPMQPYLKKIYQSIHNHFSMRPTTRYILTRQYSLFNLARSWTKLSLNIKPRMPLSEVFSKPSHFYIFYIFFIYGSNIA